MHFTCRPAEKVAESSEAEHIGDITTRKIGNGLACGGVRIHNRITRGIDSRHFWEWVAESLCPFCNQLMTLSNMLTCWVARRADAAAGVVVDFVRHTEKHVKTEIRTNNTESPRMCAYEMMARLTEAQARRGTKPNQTIITALLSMCCHIASRCAQNHVSTTPIQSFCV